MTEILVILLILAIVIIIVQATKEKKSPPPDLYSQVTSPPPKDIINFDRLEKKSKSSLDDTDYESTIFTLTGLHIGKRKDYVLNNAQEFDEVTLKWQKNNPVDDKAIAVYHENNLIGYVGSSHLHELHEILEKKFSAFIASIDYDGDFLDVLIEVEWVDQKLGKIKRKIEKDSAKKKTDSIQESQEIGPEDFMIWKSNEFPTEYCQPKKDVKDTSSFFYGKKVCISGQLDSFPYRAELAKHLWDLGADVDKSVGKSCGILITGYGVGPSKLKTARGQGVQIMEEPELIEKLNGFKSKYL